MDYYYIKSSLGEIEICYMWRNVSILSGTEGRLTNALQVMQFEKQVVWTVCETRMSAMYH